MFINYKNKNRNTYFILLLLFFLFAYFYYQNTKTKTNKEHFIVSSRGYVSGGGPGGHTTGPGYKGQKEWRNITITNK